MSLAQDAFRETSMDAPPKRIDDASVICYAIIDERC
jgi:hypothetical protein